MLLIYSKMDIRN